MDQNEFTRRVLGCERKLYRMAYCLLSNGADCQDAVQETIFAAWRRREGLRDENAFEAWLMQICVNQCRDLLRKRKRRGELPPDETYPLPPSPDPGLYEAIRSLDDALRLPVVLRYVNGYSAQETARILKMSHRTLLRRLQTAKAQLQAALREG